jgi:small-conductance mechanosensitive channel
MAESDAGPSVYGVLGVVAAAVVGALVLAEFLHLVMTRLRRRWALGAELSRRARHPLRVTLVLAAVLGALRATDATGSWVRPVENALVIAVIAAVAWLAGALAFVVEDAALQHYPVDVPDNRRARKVRTQVTLVRRVTVAVLAAVAIGAALTTFPTARTLGASLLASAGIAGVIAGLAAQSTLSNLFAGLQLAFSDWLRLDDVVVVESEWGRVEDITLSYVVVHLWDDRRLILPTSYFTGKPFQSWTRTEAPLLGTVELDVDWTVPVDAMRAELHRILESTELWDRRVSVLQVTDAVGAFVRLRALVSSADAPTDWDLRCLVRERLVAWLQQNHPAAVPHARLTLSTERATDRPEVHPPTTDDRGTHVFSGSPDGDERAATFAPTPTRPGTTRTDPTGPAA